MILRDLSETSLVKSRQPNRIANGTKNDSEATATSLMLLKQNGEVSNAMTTKKSKGTVRTHHLE